MKLYKDDILIESDNAIPVKDGEALAGVAWYKVYPDKICICQFDPQSGKNLIQEYPPRKIKIAGLPAGYYEERSRNEN